MKIKLWILKYILKKQNRHHGIQMQQCKIKCKLKKNHFGQNLLSLTNWNCITVKTSKNHTSENYL